MKICLLERFLQSRKNKMRKIVSEPELRGDEELLPRLDETELKSFSYGFSQGLFRSIDWCSIKVCVAQFDSFYNCQFCGFCTAFVCISCSSKCYHWHHALVGRGFQHNLGDFGKRHDDAITNLTISALLGIWSYTWWANMGTLHLFI